MSSLDELDEGFIFMLSLDGTHCPIWEPRPFWKGWSSHKLGGSAGVNYEIALLLHKPILAWVKGPLPPGKFPDISVFRMELKGKLPAGKRIVGDDGYKGEPEYISTRNDLDPPELIVFKERVMARHETFNQRLKTFECLTTPFRHGVDNHKVAFEAVCAITMYEIENGGTTLFDPYP